MDILADMGVSKLSAKGFSENLD